MNGASATCGGELTTTCTWSDSTASACTTPAEAGPTPGRRPGLQTTTGGRPPGPCPGVQTHRRPRSRLPAPTPARRGPVPGPCPGVQERSPPPLRLRQPKPPPRLLLHEPL